MECGDGQIPRHHAGRPDATSDRPELTPLGHLPLRGNPSRIQSRSRKAAPVTEHAARTTVKVKAAFRGQTRRKPCENRCSPPRSSEPPSLPAASGLLLLMKPRRDI